MTYSFHWLPTYWRKVGGPVATLCETVFSDIRVKTRRRKTQRRKREVHFMKQRKEICDIRPIFLLRSAYSYKHNNNNIKDI